MFTYSWWSMCLWFRSGIGVRQIVVDRKFSLMVIDLVRLLMGVLEMGSRSSLGFANMKVIFLDRFSEVAPII